MRTPGSGRDTRGLRPRGEVPLGTVTRVGLAFPILVFFGEAPVHQGELADGVLHGVPGLPRHAGLDVVGGQVALQEEVQAAVREQQRVVQHPGQSRGGQRAWAPGTPAPTLGPASQGAKHMLTRVPASGSPGEYEHEADR